MRCTTSIRNPSTPRSSQNRSVSSIASRTSSFDQSRSGWFGVNRWRYHDAVGSSHVQAGPCDSAACQLLGGVSGSPSRQTYQSRCRRVDRRTRLDEPRMLVARVVRHPVEHDPDVAPVRLGDEAIELLEVTEDRVDVAVVGDVVAVVDHRRGEHRRQPDRVDAEPLEMIEVRDDPREVADAVAGRVAEAAGVDLVDGGGLPPRRLGGTSLWFDVRRRLLHVPTHERPTFADVICRSAPAIRHEFRCGEGQWASWAIDSSSSSATVSYSVAVLVLPDAHVVRLERERQIVGAGLRTAPLIVASLPPARGRSVRRPPAAAPAAAPAQHDDSIAHASTASEALSSLLPAIAHMAAMRT